MTKKIIELVIYTVKEAQLPDFASRQSKAIDSLSEYDGFVRCLNFKLNEKQDTFVDYVIWENKDTALAAQETIKTDSNCLNFFQSIDEIIHSSHYTPEDEDKLLCSSDFDNNAFLELALGEILTTKLPEIAGIKSELFSIVESHNGLIKVTGAIDTSHQQRQFDTLVWATPDKASKALAQIHQTQQCQRFMSTFEKDVFYGNLEFIGTSA